MRPTISLCALAAAGLLAVSCVSTRPIHYYTIELPAAPANQSKPDGLTILIGNHRHAGNPAGRPHTLSHREQRGWRVRIPSVDGTAWRDGPGGADARAALLRESTSGCSRHPVPPLATIWCAASCMSSTKWIDGAIETRISLHVELIDMKTNRNVWDYLAERSGAGQRQDGEGGGRINGQEPATGDRRSYCRDR